LPFGRSAGRRQDYAREISGRGFGWPKTEYTSEFEKSKKQGSGFPFSGVRPYGIPGIDQEDAAERKFKKRAWNRWRRSISSIGLDSSDPQEPIRPNE
jgi:hypothetical protein